MKLYFVRHGQTDTNAANVKGSSTDQPLNQLGIQQAKGLAQELKDIRFDAIISSPLKRAYETAELINEYHNLPIEVSTAWQERDAETYIDLNTWNDLFDFSKNASGMQGESLTEFFERIYHAMDNLQQEYSTKTILVVSHGGVQHAVYAYANKLPWSGNMRISPTANCEYRIYDC